MRLIRFLQDSVNDKAILKSIFLVGSPGAGKSYVIKTVGRSDIVPRVVNTDIWTERYMDKDGNIDWSIHGDKIERLTATQLYNYINSMLPLFVDSTSSKISNLIDRKLILEGCGYDTGCIFINTSLETALKRNADRPRKVPEEYLIDTYKKVMSFKSNYKAGFKYFKEINNNDGELTDAVILKAFKEVQGFFTEPIHNPKGIEIISDLRNIKGKYLSDLPEYKDLKSKLSWWYKK